MIVPVMAISNLVLTRQIYSEETNGAHAHNRDRVPLTYSSLRFFNLAKSSFCRIWILFEDKSLLNKKRKYSACRPN